MIRMMNGMMSGSLAGMAARGLGSIASSMFSSTLNLALLVLLIIAHWKLYEMAGEEGWSALIPYYSTYIRFKISGKKNLFIPYLICILIYPIVGIVGFVMIVVAIFDASLGGVGAGLVVAIILTSVLSIAAFVFKIIMTIGIANNFGKSTGFAIGMIFLPYIFYSILAFSSDTEYVGGYDDIPPVSEDGEFENSNEDIEVVENVRSADDEPEEKEYTNADEFNDVFNKAVNSSSDDSEHVSGDVE